LTPPLAASQTAGKRTIPAERSAHPLVWKPSGQYKKEFIMGIFNALKSQLIDIIEWLDDSSDTMVYRFYRPENEIMNGAR
jgi:hypothetical protein